MVRLTGPYWCLTIVTLKRTIFDRWFMYPLKLAGALVIAGVGGNSPAEKASRGRAELDCASDP
jgi:hypothetical protein